LPIGSLTRTIAGNVATIGDGAMRALASRVAGAVA
jgi:hypothetical protein